MIMTEMLELQKKINKVVLKEDYLSEGVQFLSEYYGVITATNIDHLGDGLIDVYGFDGIKGLPRSNKYPTELQWVGFPIDLDILLQALYKKEGYFDIEISKYSVDITFKLKYRFTWKLGEGLYYQNKETINILNTIFCANEN